MKRHLAFEKPPCIRINIEGLRLIVLIQIIEILCLSGDSEGEEEVKRRDRRDPFSLLHWSCIWVYLSWCWVDSLWRALYYHCIGLNLY